jgi:hypothetical protein
MAWYPGATKMELQPESDAQPAIRPTQMIVHSIVAPWTAQRLYEYWKSTSLESHFGLGYAGDLAQYIGTETRADANAGANRRADGSGAVSVETASDTKASDPWTAAQVEELIKLGVWMHQKHSVPLRVCRSHSDPGFGYHSLFPQWSTSGTACPGPARIRQFRQVVFPGIVARATGTTTDPQEDDVTPEQVEKAVLDVLKSRAGQDALYKGVLKNDKMPAPLTSTTRDTNPTWQLASIETDTNNVVRSMKVSVETQAATIDQLVKTVATLAAGLGDLDPAAIVAELTAAIESVTVRLDVDGS